MVVETRPPIQPEGEIRKCNLDLRWQSQKTGIIERCMKYDDLQFIPAAPRPSYDTPMTRLEPTVAASLKQVRSNLFVF